MSLNFLFPLLWTLAWLPAWLWAAERWRSSGRSRYVCALSLCLGLQLLSGHLDVIFSGGLLGLGFCLWRSRLPGQRLRTWLGLIAAGLLALGLAAPQLWAGYEFLAATYRGQGLSLEMASYYTFDPLRLPEWFVPGFSGDPQGLDNLRRVLGDPVLGDYLILNVFAGSLTLLLVCLALSRLRQDSEPRFWSLAACGFVLLSLGRHTPLFELCFRYLPGFGMFRYPEKYALPAALALAMLAALGCDAWLAGRISRRALRLAAAGPALAFLALWAWLQLDPDALLARLSARFANAPDPERLRQVVMPMLSGLSRQLLLGLGLLTSGFLLLQRRLRRDEAGVPWLLLAGLGAELLILNQGLVWRAPEVLDPGASKLTAWRPMDQTRIVNLPFEPEPSPSYLERYQNQYVFSEAAYETALLINNIASRAGFYQAYGLAPLKFTAIATLYYAYQDSENSALLRQIEDLLAISRIVSTLPGRDRLLAAEPGRYRRLMRDPATAATLWERRSATQRVSFMTQSLLLPAPLQIGDLLSYLQATAPELDLSRVVVLQQDEALERALAAVPAVTAARPQARIERLRETPTELELSLETNNSGYLLVRDNDFPGWQVSVDGVAAPVLKANGFARAVRVGAGRHRVRWIYQPTALGPGLAIAGLSLVLLLALGAAFRRWPQARPETLPGS